MLFLGSKCGNQDVLKQEVCNNFLNAWCSKKLISPDHMVNPGVTFRWSSHVLATVGTKWPLPLLAIHCPPHPLSSCCLGEQKWLIRQVIQNDPIFLRLFSVLNVIITTTRWFTHLRENSLTTLLKTVGKLQLFSARILRGPLGLPRLFMF